MTRNSIFPRTKTIILYTIAAWLCLFLLKGSAFPAENETGKPEVELGNVSSGFTAPAKVADPVPGSGEDDLTLSANILDMSLTYPQSLEENKVYLIHTLKFRHLRFLYENREKLAEPGLADDLYAAYYTVALREKVDGSKTVTALASAGISSDFECVSLHDLKLNFAVLFDRTLENSNIVGIGVGYASNMGEALVFPVFNYTQNNTKPLTVKIIIPLYAQIMYECSSRVKAGVFTGFYADNYRISRGNSDSDSLRYQYLLAGPQALISLDDNWQLNAQAGIVLFQRLGLFRSDDKVRSLDFKDSWFLSLGLSYRL